MTGVLLSLGLGVDGADWPQSPKLEPTEQGPGPGKASASTPVQREMVRRHRC